jgi:hypothetical protein
MGGGKGDGGVGALQEQEAKRKAEVAARITEINDIFDAGGTSRNALYDKAAENAFNLDKLYMDENRADTERMNRFALARQGLAGGSQEVDRNKALLNTYNEGLLRAGQRGERLKAEWMQSDEDLRNNLIKQVSVDPQAFNAASAQAQLSAANQARQNAGTDQTLGNLFQQFADTYALSRYNQGVNSAMGQVSPSNLPTGVSTRKNYQGR